MKKKYYTWESVHAAATKIVLDMYKDEWRPDYIVGITRGGLPLAVILSHMLDVPCNTLKVALRNGTENECETNCWMSEDAYGYDNTDPQATSSVANRKNILIVDDINDTGATFQWIQRDWMSSCMPDDHAWNDIWNNNVRFATMTENLSSDFPLVRYYWDEVNKLEDDVWLVYPYEYS